MTANYSKSDAVGRARRALGAGATREAVDAWLAAQGLPPSHGKCWDVSNPWVRRLLTPREPVVVARRDGGGPTRYSGGLPGLLRLADLAAEFGVGTVRGWLDVIQQKEVDRGGGLLQLGIVDRQDGAVAVSVPGQVPGGGADA